MASESRHPYIHSPPVSSQNPPSGYIYSPPQYYSTLGYPTAPEFHSSHSPNLEYHYLPSGQPLENTEVNVHSKGPSSCICPHCHNNVVLKVVKKPGNFAWICCLVLFFFCFPFCLYSLVCDPCLDTYGICPSCQNLISVKNPL